MWVALWSLLVAGAIAVPVLLVRDLWRRLTALGRQLGESATVLSREPAVVDLERIGPTLLDAGTPVRMRRQRRTLRAMRTVRRAQVCERTVDRWQHLGLL